MDNEVIIAWIVTPLLIFLARIFDVSVGTIRIILMAKGFKKIAPILGFFESLIWILAVSQIMQHLNNFFYYFAYALGFATGTYLGIILEEKLSLGFIILRVITYKDANELVIHLREKKYSVTVLDAEGVSGAVKLIFLVLKRINAPDIIKLIKEYNPNAFYTMEDLKFVSGGVIPVQEHPMISSKLWNFNIRRR